MVTRLEIRIHWCNFSFTQLPCQLFHLCLIPCLVRFELFPMQFGQQDSQASGTSFQPGPLRDVNALQFHEIRLCT